MRSRALAERFISFHRVFEVAESVGVKLAVGLYRSPYTYGIYDLEIKWC